MRYEFRSLTWADKETCPRRPTSVFRAGWDDTLTLLAREVDLLDGRDPVIIQVDAPEAAIRRDGMLYARAKVGHPGVAISFMSRHGPLRYATDAYEQQWSGAMPGWQANVRAIALALEALRAVDRYGVTRRGEQYTGWLAIAAPAPLFASADEALRWMRGFYAADRNPAEAATISPKLLYYRLARMLHPDAGGSRADWERLDTARRLLGSEGLL